MLAAEQAQGLPITVGVAEGASEKVILQSVQENKIDLLITLAHVYQT